MEAACADEPPALPALNLNLHAIIILMQAENGLRHRDYRRYRKYLARRLQKLRRAAGVTCGRGRIFVKKDITEDIANSVDHLMVLLLNAERSWSYSMELKEASTLDGQRKLKHVAVSRLSRAAHWASKLKDLCRSKTDPQSSLEATAYSDWLEGLLFMEREHWEEAVAKLTSAKVIYTELGKVGSLHDQDVFFARQQELDPPIRFSMFNSGSNIDPVDADIFASSPDLSAKFDEIRAKKAASAVAAKASGGDEFYVFFAGENIPVLDSGLRTRCSLVLSYVEKAIGSNSDLMDTKMREKQFTAALGEIDSALAAVSSLSNSLNANNGGAARMATSSNSGKVSEMKGSLTVLKNFLVYQRLFLLFTKNKNVCRQLLADSSKFVGLEIHSFTENSRKPFVPCLEAASAQRVHELAHLLDQRLELLKEMQSTPGVDAHDLLKMQLRTEEFVCRTLRACFIADCYVIDRKWAEATALVEHAEGLAATAQENYDNFKLAVESTDPSQVSDMADFLSGLKDLSDSIPYLDIAVSGARCRQSAIHALLSTLQVDGSTGDNKGAEGSEDATDDRRWSILNRPLQWIEPIKTTGTKKTKKSGEGGVEKDTLIVDEIPCGFNAVPCKPVFFDIASNFISFPDVDHRAGIVKKKVRGDSADATVSEGGGGGIVKNLLGWFSG